MDMRMGQRGWMYGNGRMDLKCICIYCMYSCVREGGGVGTVFGSSPVLPHTV
ncbi:hypothetical protein HanHA89_Chr15g0636741 [Helianthus annuus]|nr:hypothetical protein HanHA89_Chr15g0636741 [Helianthus annuus]